MLSNLSAFVQRTYGTNKPAYLVTIFENGVRECDLMQFRAVMDDFGYIVIIRRVS